MLKDEIYTLGGTMGTKLIRRIKLICKMMKLICWRIKLTQWWWNWCVNKPNWYLRGLKCCTNIEKDQIDVKCTSRDELVNLHYKHDYNENVS